MRPIHRRLLNRRVALCLSTTLLSAGLLAGGLLSPAAASATTNREAALLARIDHARAVHGLAPLRTTPSLMAYAHKHSAAMASHEFLFHTRNFSVVCCWSRIGENIAFNSTVKTYDVVHRVNGFEAEAEAVKKAWRSGDFQGMADAVPDRMVEAIALAGTPDEVRRSFDERFADVYERTLLWPPAFRGPEGVRAVVDALRRPAPGR